MIDNASLEREWIMKLRNERFPKRDPGIIEKAIYALTLLERLSERQLHFVFKGGTSLILVLDEFNRFSIDIDIVTGVNQKELQRSLADIANNEPFTRFEVDVRNSKLEIPKSHYKFYYSSNVKGREDYVLLDALHEEAAYPVLVERKIDHFILIHTNNSASQEVLTPDVDCLLGDKLTAFAPRTTGIDWSTDSSSGNDLKILKQIFDIGRLFDKMVKLGNVSETFRRIAAVESRYRGTKITAKEVLEDIFEAALLIGFRGLSDRELYQLLLRGCTKLSNYIFTGRFVEADMILAASKIAFLAVSLQKEAEGAGDIEITDEPIEIRSFSRLNRLRNINIKAFRLFKEAVLLREGAR